VMTIAAITGTYVLYEHAFVVKPRPVQPLFFRCQAMELAFDRLPG
jgi:hypothetical protein